MLSSSPSGLRGAPITRLLLGGVVISSTFASVFDVKHHFPLILQPHVLVHGQLWRLVLWQLVYADAADVLFASLALYNLRAVERHFGTRKFAAMALAAWGITTVITPAMLALASLVTKGAVTTVPSGMTPIIFAILFQFVAVVPPTYKFRLAAPSSSAASGPNATGASGAGFEVSDKSYIYLLMAHLATSRLPGSLIAAASGWLAGALWDGGCLPSFARRLPSFLDRLLAKPAVNIAVRGRPAVQQEFRTRQAGGATAGRDGASGGDTGGGASAGGRMGVNDMLDAFTTAGVARPDLAPPSEQDVQTLCAMMGIPRDVAVQHLQAAGGSIERAAETLLAAAND